MEGDVYVYIIRTLLYNQTCFTISKLYSKYTTCIHAYSSCPLESAYAYSAFFLQHQLN